MSSAQLLALRNMQHSRVMCIKYKSKIQKIKRRIKKFVFENAALADEVSHVQAELVVGREDRRFLLKRLMEHENFDAERMEREYEEKMQQKQLTRRTKAPPRPKAPPKRKAAAAPTLAADGTLVPPGPKKRGPKKRTPVSAVAAERQNRMKPRDKVILDASGKPQFPINLCSILIHAIGDILANNHNFYNAHWIYPVGYVATRIYAHPRDPQRRCVFTCKILNNAGIPQFQIIPDNDLDSVFFGETADVCHQILLESLQRTLADVVQLPLRVQGEKFFGLANATIKTLIQMDPNYKSCYNFKNFLTPQDGEAFLAAADDENDPTVSFDALQMLIASTAYNQMPNVRAEPPDELFDFK